MSELQGHVESLISELRLNSQSETTLTQAKRNDLYLAEYQRLLTAQEKALDRHSKYVYRHVVDLATSHCDGSAYRDLLLAFDSWEAAEDDWTLLTWRVHLGVSRRWWVRARV